MNRQNESLMLQPTPFRLGSVSAAAV